MQNTESGQPWMDHGSVGDGDEVGTPPNRRDFLKLFGVGAAASLAACGRIPVREAIPLLIPAEEVTPGVAAHYATTCLACPSACGLVATVRDGRPVKLEGAQSHPLSRGGLCAIGQAELRGLYEPTRLRCPSIAGLDVSWAQLDRHVMERLQAITDGGRSVLLFTPTLVSPTARAAVDLFLGRFRGEHVQYDAGVTRSAAVREAYRVLDGTAVQPSYDLAQVDLWVSLASDLLGTGPDPVAHTASWAERRRQATTRGLLRHVQVESSLSLTGANADERWLHTPHERRQMAVQLLGAVCERADGALAQEVRLALRGVPGVNEPGRLQVLATDIVKVGRHALVTSGSDDVGEQVAVALINRVIAAEESTMSLRHAVATLAGEPGALDRFQSAVSGRVAAVVTIECDPVADMGNAEPIASALGKLDLVVAIATQPNATTRAAGVVVAAHHTLERWSDAEPRSGLRTLAQPSIRPLFDSREPFANLLTWAGTDGTDWRGQIETNWRQHVCSPAVAATPGGWAELWSRTVRDAGLGDTAGWYSFPATSASVTRDAVPLATAIGTLLSGLASAVSAGDQVELIEEVAIRDGSRAHVPWLRELPDPLTRAAWTACARLAPQRAQALGVRDGDVIEVATDAGRVRMPVRIQPGQHPTIVAIPIGYGRAAGDPAAWNAFRLRPPGGSSRGFAAAITRTGERALLPLVQVEASAHGRPVVHQLHTLGERPHGTHAPDADLWQTPANTSPQWEMVVDLDACTGCSACVVACQAENNIPVVGPEEMGRHRDMHWLRLDRYYLGDEKEPDVLFEPMLCAQCGDAPCETVCPVLATVHSADGLNQQIYNRCVGTRYCANNCPYKVRRFNWFENSPTEPIERMVLNPDVVVRSRGVMEKCTFCVQRIQASRLAARQDGQASYEVQTACQQSCPARAIHFGDATVTDGPLTALKNQPNAFQVLAELGIAPSITYLARHRNRLDGEAAAGHDGEPGGSGHGEGS